MLEEFPGVLPSQLAGEPLIPLLRIIEARHYAGAVKADEEHAARVRRGDAKAEDAPAGPMFDVVSKIMSEKIRMAEEDDNR